MEKALKSAWSTRVAEAREGIGRGSWASGFISVQWAQCHNSHGGWPGGSPREAASVQHQEHSMDRHDASSLSCPASHTRLSLELPSVDLCPGSSVCIPHPVAVVAAGGGCGGDRLPPRVGAPGRWGSR